MAEKTDPQMTVVFEERLMSKVITQEALISLLEKVGTITRSELIEEIKRLKGGKRAIMLSNPTGRSSMSLN